MIRLGLRCTSFQVELDEHWEPVWDSLSVFHRRLELHLESSAYGLFGQEVRKWPYDRGFFDVSIFADHNPQNSRAHHFVLAASLGVSRLGSVE